MEFVTDGKKLISSGKARMEVRLTKNIDGKRSGLEKCESLACRKAFAVSNEEKSVRLRQRYEQIADSGAEYILLP